jgi:hypothetical protein
VHKITLKDKFILNEKARLETGGLFCAIIKQRVCEILGFPEPALNWKGIKIIKY